MSENKNDRKPATYVKPSALKGGEIFEGVFTRTHSTPSIFDDSKVMSTHYLENDSETFGINGTAQLDAIMKGKEVGARYKIEYTGKETITRKNGKTAETHSWNIIDA